MKNCKKEEKKQETYKIDKDEEARQNLVGLFSILLDVDRKINPQWHKPMNDYEKRHFELVNKIIEQFKIDYTSIHGITHWRRVWEIGNFLSEKTGADKEVVNHFAYLHDAKRQNENDDLGHGERASIFVKELYDKKLLITSKYQLEKLIFACRFHDIAGVQSDDITIKTCWDADRLDLWRVGIVPNEKFLNTNVAKNEKTINLWRR